MQAYCGYDIYYASLIDKDEIKTFLIHQFDIWHYHVLFGCMVQTVLELTELSHLISNIKPNSFGTLITTKILHSTAIHKSTESLCKQQCTEQ